MAGLAFVFPGQGSQQVGMGASLLESGVELFDRYLADAEAASGLPLRRLCLEGPIEELTRTDVAQPALFALSLSLADTARDRGLRPDYVAGHSLGEYTAAVVSGALSAADGIRLVVERGRQMAAIQSERPGAMAAVLGLSIDAVAELCTQASEVGQVVLANLNSPSQVVVSGEVAGVDRLIGLAQAAGARRALRLQVGAAFHSPLMRPVQTRLAERMEDIRWTDPTTPLVSNASGAVVRTADGVRQALVDQIASPVRWTDCVSTLAGAGCATFLELGPQRVLSGLIRQILPEADVAAVDALDKLDAFAASHERLLR